MKKVNHNLFNIINLYIKELCCSHCHFKKMHQEHTLLELSDEEGLKKENISLESDEKEFNEYLNKTESLKSSIENEIKEIDKQYDKVLNEIGQSFKAKHEKLIKEENELKDKLQLEVTKAKENLEKFWSLSNNEIIVGEKVNKGINKIKNEEKSMMKTLSYVSKINKSQKEMKKLSVSLIKSIKFSYEQNENSLKFDEFYFNGIPIQNNFEFKNVGYDTLELKWKIDDLNIKDVKKEDIKYLVEMKEENKKYKQIYEGENSLCSVDNLTPNANYEFRVCCFYKEVKGLWSQSEKIKTNEFNSLILKDSPKKGEFIQKLKEWSGYKKMELLYRGTRDGMDSNNFHNKCDNKGPNYVLIENNKGNIFGGYSSISWESSGGYKNVPECFIFTLKNIYNIQPTKFPSNNSGCNVYHGIIYGPLFGNECDFYIYSTFGKERNSDSYFPKSYQDVLGKGKSIFTGDSNNNNTRFYIKEMEVFKLYN